MLSNTLKQPDGLHFITSGLQIYRELSKNPVNGLEASAIF